MEKLDFLKLFENDQQTRSLSTQLNRGETAKKIVVNNIHGSHKSILAYNLIKNTRYNFLFILDNLEDALYFLDDLNNLNTPNSNYLFQSAERIKSGDKNVILERIDVLNKLTNKNRVNIITYPDAIKERIINKREFSTKKISFKVNEEINQEKIIDKLNKLNFTINNFVSAPGEFAIRGLIIDIFPFSSEEPYRLILDNNIIEEIRCFNAIDQTSTYNVSSVDIIANVEEDFKSLKNTNLFSYLTNNTVLWISSHNLLFRDKTDRKKYISNDELITQLNKYQCIYTGDYPTNEKKLSKFFYNSAPQFSFNKNFEILIDHLDEYRKKNYQNFILISSENQMKMVSNIFKNYLHLVTLLKTDNSLREGFIDHNNKILLYTDHHIFERHHQYKSKRVYKLNNTISIDNLTNLKKGDYVVHFDYGIGVYDGLRIQNINNKKQESIRIIYKNNDILYLSIHALHKIAKHKDEEFDLKLDKLGSPRWKKLKEKVKNKIKVVAFDLIKLYAKRKISKGFSFSKDTYLQSELEASFIFQDTEDQIKITKAIKKDMEKPNPMDRLICGDVGFGKTELAIRAAFKAVADNKQVVVLVPTTILALQHHKTFKNRLTKFPCTVKYLNRFVTRKETLTVLEELKEGLIDIIIGTHRLLSKDVEIPNLGLLIIDEEQKFGVSAKDKLKTLKENVDTLTLTATPIPRTLQFSLMGSRDLSIMTTYPKNRNPIETRVTVFNYELIKEIITYEISRGGQVFFVHNRIANIIDLQMMLAKMCPNLNIQIAHGKMESKKLEKTILDFINGSFDVLITTTIIENGLDIPNANTIIINNAQNFGLSDLHQMRGRVGRSNKKAFCYLMTPPFDKIKDIAVQRLNAISNLARLGDGFNIAMKDLEIRGAGDMLGAEQSGFIEEMGFTHYQKILDEAIVELKESYFKKESFEDTDSLNAFLCSIETDLELLIPNNYVSDMSERMKLYKKLSFMKTKSELELFQKEINDRFGTVPQETNELIKSIMLRSLGEKINCEKMILKNQKMILIFDSKNQVRIIAEKTLNNLMFIIQKDKEKRYSIKNENDKIKIYINNIKNIDDGIKIITEIYH
ncbi:MAG: transcription-repair coupling factor [Flavobacteriales bacterium]|nr:transcription-repair coupling factor [Flavobacteriales bacterium]